MTDVCYNLPWLWQHGAGAGYSRTEADQKLLIDASFDSPYRTGRHVPLNQEHNGLTSIATASDSRADISSSYPGERGHISSPNLGDFRSIRSPSAHSPYSPGMRSASAQRATTQDGFEQQSPSEIPMQRFQNGLPPPPPVSYSWSRVDKWCDENYPELLDQLCEGCTENDLNELELQLNRSLPTDVRKSLQVHDGQERGGLPTGIIFSNMLLDCEEIVQEWDNWRRMSEQYLLDQSVSRPPMSSKALGGGVGSNGLSNSSEASSSKQTSPRRRNPQTWRQDLISRQDCVPPNAIQKAYAHPGWIPLVRDWGGNNLAIDLAPGPTGEWGQVILFGRDYDTKYVVARSWGAFLAIFADDLNSGKWFVDEENYELKLREFKSSRVEPSYFDILRWRMDQKYRRAPPPTRRSMMSGTASPTSPSSPYLSASEANSERGRSLHRINSGSSPMVSPMRPGYGRNSPLSKVTEEKTEGSGFSKSEGKRSLSVNTGVSTANKPLQACKAPKLVEVDTPPPIEDDTNTPRLDAMKYGDSTGSDKGKERVSLLSSKAEGKKPITMLEEGLKTIEI